MCMFACIYVYMYMHKQPDANARTRRYNAYYLDPHISQPYMPMNRNFNCCSFHCASPEKMCLSNIDPSLGASTHLVLYMRMLGTHMHTCAEQFKAQHRPIARCVDASSIVICACWVNVYIHALSNSRSNIDPSLRACRVSCILTYTCWIHTYTCMH